VNLQVFGTITRSHGLKGAFKINITVGGTPELKKNEPIFIQLLDGSVPFFLEEVFMQSTNSVVVKVEDVETIEATERLVGKAVLLPEEKFPKLERSNPNSLIGFEVHDVVHGAIGKVVGIMPLRQHPIIEVEKDGKQILIPYVEEIVIDVDAEKKRVTVETPDGLIALYLD